MPVEALRTNRKGVSRGAPVSFTFDGQALQGFAGETVAAALAAAGIIAYSRDPRREGARGLFCGMGACFSCLVTIDGRAHQRACLSQLAEGQIIRSQPPQGDGADPLAPLVPPASGVAPREEMVDVLVIGAGPAGLAAATAAARHGANVVVLDERAASGGQYYKPLATSHHAAEPPDRQFRSGLALVAAARKTGVRIVQNAAVWGAYAADEVVALVDGQAVVYRPRRLALATGAYETVAPFPGWTLPGVMTTGAAQSLIRTQLVAPGRRVMIAGNGPLNLQLACEMVDAGITPLAVIESAALPDWRRLREAAAMVSSAPELLRDGIFALAKLRRHNVPVLWSRAILSAEGGDRLRKVWFAPIDGLGRRDGAAAIALEADALCIGYGFAPSTEVARALGCAHRLLDRQTGHLATETSEAGETSVSGVFAVGDGAQIGGARVAQARGELAGLTIARQLGRAVGDPAIHAVQKRLRRAQKFQSALWSIYQAPPVRLDQVADATILCRCEDVTFGRARAEVAQGRDSLAALKRNTRLGMGRCQGRYCAAATALLLERITGRPRDVEHFFAPRLPSKPFPAAALVFEKPEWGGHRRAITPNLARPTETAAQSDQSADILVIGGGVVGACLAFYFSRAGADVLVVERDDVNLQASGANAGSLHVQLLSFDFGARAEAGGGPAAATLPLGPRSIGLWRELEEACGEDLEIRVTGGLMVADSAAGMNFLKAKAELERRFGIENEIISAPDLRRLAPALSNKMLGAELALQEGKINPLRATYAVMEQARRQGARFLRGCNVTGIARAGAGFDVSTSRGKIRAGRIVNASGPWARTTGQLLGLDIPVHSAPLQMIVTEPAPPMVSHLVAHADRHLSLKQAASGGLIIGGGWTAAYDQARRINQVTRASVEGNLWVANHVLPQLAGLHVLRAWAAMNVNIDGAPIIGPVPGEPGFFNCVTSNGYTLAPVVAKLTADLLMRGRADLDITPYLIDRFN